MSEIIQESTKKEGPFPIRLGSIKKDLETEAQSKKMGLGPYIVSILENRNNLKSPDDLENEKKQNARITELEALMEKAVKKLSDWGIKL